MGSIPVPPQFCGLQGGDGWLGLGMGAAASRAAVASPREGLLPGRPPCRETLPAEPPVPSVGSPGPGVETEGVFPFPQDSPAAPGPGGEAEPHTQHPCRDSPWILLSGAASGSAALGHPDNEFLCHCHRMPTAQVPRGLVRLGPLDHPV